MNQSQLKQRTDVVYQCNLDLLQTTPCVLGHIHCCVCVPIDSGTVKCVQYCTQFS